MKVKKFISTALLSCLFINYATPSFAGVLSEDGRYETFKGDSITVNDVLEEDKVDFKVEGNTLVNIYEKQTPVGRGGSLSNDNNVYRLTKNESGDSGYLQFNLDSSLLKSNTKYTVLLNQYYNTQSSPYIIFYDRTQSREISSRFYMDDFNKNAVLETKNIVQDNTIQLLVYTGGGSGNYVEVSNEIIILEGDYTDENIEYFEGMKSSFEDKLITQGMIDNGEEKQENLGKYKVEVKSIGKNILDIDNLVSHGNISSFSDKIITSETYTKDYRWLRLKLIETYTLKPGKYYLQFKMRSDNYTYGIHEIRFEKEIDTNMLLYSTKISNPNCSSEYKIYEMEFIVEEDFDVNYLFIQGTITSSTSLQIKDLMLSEIQSTEYEPYKESVNTFYLNSPLLKEDTIEIVNGQAYHVHRYRQSVLNGNEDWVGYTGQPEGIEYPVAYIALYIDNLYANRDENTVLCDNMISIKGNDYDYNKESIYAWNRYGVTPFIFIHIYKDKLNESSLAGFKQYLSENQLKIAYRLENSVYEPIKTDLSVQLFEGTTHITNSSNIPANMEITVDRVLNRATEAVELAKAESTTENIARARMWVNLIDESSIKDQLQDEVSSITEIKDLELERKTVTSNMDLYVKSDNMLSMTLSTNSISFDNYSGVDDIEKLKALEISINSSLPYSLNSYLVTEIQNSDGSSRIDREHFNIRESSQGEYKKFLNVGEKLILKDSCEAGNNIIHNIDMKLNGNDAHKADIYKTIIKFEAEQK